jgi:hypothetical protein
MFVQLQGGLMPGQHHTPIRIGRDLHPLLALDEAAAGGDTARAKESAAESAADGIGSREVAGISASKYFSVLRSSSGEVWTCGGELSVWQGDGIWWLCSPQCFDSDIMVAVHHTGYRICRGLQWRAGSAILVGDLPAPGFWTCP